MSMQLALDTGLKLYLSDQGQIKCMLMQNNSLNYTNLLDKDNLRTVRTMGKARVCLQSYNYLLALKV